MWEDLCTVSQALSRIAAGGDADVQRNQSGQSRNKSDEDIQARENADGWQAQIGTLAGGTLQRERE